MKDAIIVTAGGTTHEVLAVELFPTQEVTKWRSLVARARLQFSGFSTGIGFLGSPEWVIGGALISGLVSAAVSDAKAKTGITLLNEAAELLNHVRAAGKFFDVSEIGGIDSPHPHGWTAKGAGLVDLEAMTGPERALFIRENNIVSVSTIGGRLEGQIEYSMLDDDFVSVRAGGRDASIRWTAVDSYSFRPGD